MKKKLIIFGIGSQAEIANFYFTRKTNYRVEGFCADDDFIHEPYFCNKPVVPPGELLTRFTPSDIHLFIAIGYSKVNSVRMSKYCDFKGRGYSFATYISPDAIILNDNFIGDNCFILEHNTVQPFVRIGNNVTVWSGNHIGHHTIIRDHTFISSHVVISGGVTIGEQCFIGVNSTFGNNINIGDRCVIGAGATMLGDAAPGGVYAARATERSNVPSSRLRGT